MKTLIAALAIIIAMSTSAFASIKSSSQCEDIIKYSTYTGVVVGVGMTVVTIASLPVAGAGIAAGTTLGYVSMWAMPYLVGTTLPVLAVGTVINGASYGVLGYMAGIVGCRVYG